MNVEASTQKTQKKQIRAGLLLSGMLIGLSFVTMLVPLALYHVAQVAAALKLRTTYLLMLAVIAVTFALGFLFREEVFLLGAAVGCFWAPLFAIAVYERKRNRPVTLSAVLFFVPTLLVLASAWMIPHISDLGDFLEQKRAEVEEQMLAGGGVTDPQTQRFLDDWREGIVKTRETPEYAALARVAAYSPPQRISWLVFDSDAAYFFIFGLLLNALASLVFLDHAFEQVERLRAVVRYVLEKRGGFSPKLVEGVSRFPMATGHEGESEDPIRIVSHRVYRPDDSRLASAFLLPNRALNTIFFGGYEFALERLHNRWQLRSFALPLWLGLLSIVFLVFVSLYYGEPQVVIETASSGQYGLAIALGSVVSMLLLSVLAVQGMLVFYLRLVPLALMLVVLVALSVALWSGLNPYVLVAAMGSVGLLDYIYDFRGRSVSKD